jgi:hypothetical protein
VVLLLGFAREHSEVGELDLLLDTVAVAVDALEPRRKSGK